MASRRGAGEASPVHRVHLFTGSGALCGALHVLDSSSVAAAVTCPQCLARMDRTPAERLEAFEAFFPAARIVGDRDPE